MALTARLLEDQLNAAHSHPASSVPCLCCGATARFVDMRPKTITSVLGALTLRRGYYHCATCGRGFCPQDQALGLDNCGLSPGVARMAALVGATTSFQEGAMLLRELAGLPVDAKQVERTAKRVGTAVAEDEVKHWEQAVPASDVMYAGVDGTGIPMRP
ncbi:MAG: ISKra4 family transposase, partial [Thermaerobacter sp.]|nr:ISKra4 family transposase [Thermaerobacter sp.]